MNQATTASAMKTWERYGHFDDDHDEFVITTAQPPLPWDNYLFNDRYLSVVDHLGRGWSKLHTGEGHVTFLWHLSAMYERDQSRAVYLRDAQTGEIWSIGGIGVGRVDGYACHHGLGYTRISCHHQGIAASWRITVPAGDDPVELWQLEVTNESGRARAIDVFTYGAVSLRGALTHGYIHFCRGEWRDEVGGLFFANNAPGLPHPGYKAFAAWDRPVSSYDASRNAFRGLYDSMARPAAVVAGQCGGAAASREPMAACLHTRLELAPNQAAQWHQLSGIAGSPQEAAALRERYLSPDAPDNSYRAIRVAAQRRSETVTISSPDPMIDRLINVWSKQQVALGAAWGRWGWRGYRDIIQQTHGAIYFDLPRVRANLSEAMTWQMRDGFAVRGWAPFSPKRYADSALWLCYTVNDYVKESGDRAYVRRVLPYRDGGAGPVWEHLLRGGERAFTDVGPHGLPLIHQGDWNDSLSAVGEKGVGESVWLAEALCWALKELAELFEACELPEPHATVRDWHRRMVDRINEEAWDGRWYVRGFRDDGQPIGSSKNTEGRIYLNAQTWAVLGDVAPPDRRAAMLEAMEEHLRVPYGYLTLSPPYQSFDPSIGRITGMPPGTGENAAVYVHANAFCYAALLKLNQPDKALELLQTIHPCNAVNPTQNSGATPYVLPNSYYGPGYAIRPGRIEGTWVTGSASWYLHQTVEHLCGVHRTHHGLRFEPRLPAKWDRVHVERAFRGTRYAVAVTRDTGCSGVRVAVDGTPVDGCEIASDVSLAHRQVTVQAGESP